MMQLKLHLDATKKEKKKGENKKNYYLKDKLSTIRRRTEEIREIIHRQNPGISYQDSLYQYGCEAVSTAREEWYSLNPEIQKPIHKYNQKCLTSIRKKKYTPWKDEVKHRSRCTRLLKKAKRMFTFPSFWMEYVQEQTSLYPWRYGVCQIVGQNCTCPDYENICKKRQLIKREEEELMQRRQKNVGS